MLASLLTWIIFGLVVGLLARAIYPGDQSLGMLETTLLGVVGSFIGGALASLIGGYPMFEFRTAGFLGSLLGAILVLALSGFGTRRSAR